MAWFKNSDNNPAALVREMNEERLLERLEAKNYQVSRPEDGSAPYGAIFDGVVCTFPLNDVSLSVFAQAWIKNKNEYRDKIVLAAEKYNSQSWFGTAAAIIDDDGELHISCTIPVITRVGISDEQLDDAIDLGLEVGINCVKKLQALTEEDA